MLLTPNHRIVIAADAPAAVKTGADELQQHLLSIAGLDLPLVQATETAADAEILVGASTRLAAVAPGLDVRDLHQEEYLLRTIGSRLIIVGSGRRGTLYGVYGLLRDYLGCRWFTPECSVVPKQTEIDLPELDERRMPAFEYRNFILDGVDDPAWCARNEFNGFNSPDDPRYGGHVAHWQYGHSLFALCKAEDYFDEHPEYFDSTSRQKDVIDDHINLCFTNDDVVEIVADNLRRVMRQTRERQEATPEKNLPTIFYLAQHDGGAICTCPDCQAIIDAEGEGEPSATLIHFCNRVVEEIGDEFPDYRMMTIAYRFSRRPPKTLRPDPRLIVQLCSIECCQSHPYATCDDPDNVLFREDMAGWQELAEQLWVWDYMPRLWHPFLVGPGFDSTAANYRWFHEHGVRGMFTQTGGERDFKWLNAWLMCQMMRDPYRDWTVLRDEFLEAYYGAAADSLRRFQQAVQGSVVKGNHHLHYKEGTVKPFVSADVIAAGDRLFAEALDAVKSNETLWSRVQEEYMHFLCTKLQHACRDSVLNRCRVENDHYVFERSPGMQQEVAAFVEWRDNRFGDEVQAYTGKAESGSCMLHVESDMITLENGTLQLEFLPRLAGRLVGLRHDDRNLLHTAPCVDGSFNLDNGYREEWLHAPGTYKQESTSSWSFGDGAPRATEAGSERSVADSNVVYEQTFETGGKFMHPLQWERWTRLARTAPVFQIESMVVNRGITDVNSAVEALLPLNLGDIAEVSLNGDSLTGETIKLTAEAAAEGILLRSNGLQLHWQVAGEIVDSVQVWVNLSTQCITIRTETRPLVLPPGAGRRFCQNIKIET